MILNVLFFALGLALLVVGAEALVRGAVRLAALLGISPLVVGLTVVAYGTSAPEAAVSARAALAGQPDLALGNVIGSNIFNILLILGVSAVITPLTVHLRLLLVDLWIMLAASAVVGWFAWIGSIPRWAGLLLLGSAVAYTVWCIRESRTENAPVRDEYAHEFAEHPTKRADSWVVSTGFVLIGLLLLVLGAHWLVQGSVAIAIALGVSELIIGLTIVAAGTSLPEVATSIVAAIRGERDVAVGNVIGSNIFNILTVLGLASILAPSGVAVSAAAARFDIPAMIVVAAVCLPIFYTGRSVARWEGWLLLAGYVVYTALTVSRAQSA